MEFYTFVSKTVDTETALELGYCACEDCKEIMKAQREKIHNEEFEIVPFPESENLVDWDCEICGD